MATPASINSDPPSPPGTRTGRQQTISYADLMKPDEDWRNLPNPADRRKIQNRLAQRAYRRSLRDRNKEVKRLKKQLEILEEAHGIRRSASPGQDEEQGGTVCPPDSPRQSNAIPSTPLSMSSPEGMGDCFPAWSPTSDPKHNSAFWGLGHDQVMSPDFDLSSMDFDTVPDLVLSPNSDSSRTTRCSTQGSAHGTGHDRNNYTCMSPPTPQYSPFSPAKWDSTSHLGPMISTADSPNFTSMDASNYQKAYTATLYQATPSQYIDPMLSVNDIPPTKKIHHHQQHTSHSGTSSCCCHSRSNSPNSTSHNRHTWKTMAQGLGLVHPNTSLAMSFQQAAAVAAPTPNSNAGGAKVVAFLVQYNADGSVAGISPDTGSSSSSLNSSSLNMVVPQMDRNSH